MCTCLIGELILVQLGPSTNVAVALRIDPEFGRKLKASYMMAGAYEGKITTLGKISNDMLCFPVHSFQ